MTEKELQRARENAEKAKKVSEEADRVLAERMAEYRAEIARKIAELDAEKARLEALDGEVTRVVVEEPTRVVVETETVNEEVKEEPTTERITAGVGIRNFVAGGALVAAIALGWVLWKESKHSEVKSIPTTTTTVTDTVIDGKEATIEETYTYNYAENNVVTVDKTTVITEGDKTTTIVETEPYEELTTEKFEELCTSAIKFFEERDIVAERADIVKFVAVFNIDKLKQDNPELVKSLLGTQTIEEFYADANHVSDTLIDYDVQNIFGTDENGKYVSPEWQAYVDSWFKGAFCPNTETLVSIADFAFDSEQQELIKAFEARRNAILKESDLSVRSDMTHDLLLDVLNAKGDHRKLDDSTLYFLLRHCIVPLDSMYNWDFLNNKSTLKIDAHNLMVQFIAPVGSSDQEIQNSVMSGLYRNMMNSFARCQSDENVKTLTK